MIESRLQFFDRIADQWDGWVDLERMGQALREGLIELEVSPSANVVDLGCGTGNLTAALTQHLEPDATITAVDFSERMLEQARRKVSDGRARWVCADAAALPLADQSADHIICFSAWPHFPEPLQTLDQVRRVLKPGGTFTVWHAISRQMVNAIHAEASPAVADDLLPPISTLAELLRSSGFAPRQPVDDEQRYSIQATLPGA
jgi:ubiquinone/menaquinone biosynthesis C-methylase UbiE